MKTSVGIELVEFVDVDEKYTKLSKNEPSNEYKEINQIELEDDKLYLQPEEADKLLEQYQKIDLDYDSSVILKSNINLYKRQLERMKVCTNNIKYKLSILTLSSICFIDRFNTIKCYAVKKINPLRNEIKSMFLVIDLENFYDSVKNIHTDLNVIYNSMYSILNKAQKNHYTTIASRIRQYQSMIESIGKKYNKQKVYTASIKTLTGILSKISKQEKTILKRIQDTEVNQKNNSHSLYGNTTSYSFQLKTLQDDLNQLVIYKNETTELLTEVKFEYNNFLLEFDSSLYENILLLNEVTLNFKKLETI